MKCPITENRYQYFMPDPCSPWSALPLPSSTTCHASQHFHKSPFAIDPRPLEEMGRAHAGLLAASRALRTHGF